MSEYSAVDITKDAVKFSRSRFGQHYLARLEAAKARALQDAVNIDLPSEFCGKRAAQATAIDAEIDYFKTASTVAADPNLMQRLIEKARGRKQPDVDV